MSDLKSILEQAEDLLKQAASTSGVQAQELREKAMLLLEQVKEQTAALQDKVAEKAREAGETTQAFVKENPLKALGIAAGVGLLLGAMLKGKQDAKADENADSKTDDKDDTAGKPARLN
jgi:ElaB/YqjD/DUF883 family membrane-anchored ribosome-binding protein